MGATFSRLVPRGTPSAMSCRRIPKSEHQSVGSCGSTSSGVIAQCTQPPDSSEMILTIKRQSVFFTFCSNGRTERKLVPRRYCGDVRRQSRAALHQFIPRRLDPTLFSLVLFCLLYSTYHVYANDSLHQGLILVIISAARRGLSFLPRGCPNCSDIPASPRLTYIEMGTCYRDLPNACHSLHLPIPHPKILTDWISIIHCMENSVVSL